MKTILQMINFPSMRFHINEKKCPNNRLSSGFLIINIVMMQEAIVRIAMIPQIPNTILVLLIVKLVIEKNEIKGLNFRTIVNFIQKTILTLIRLKL